MYSPIFTIKNIFKFEIFNEYFICSYIDNNNEGIFKIYDKSSLVLKNEIETLYPVTTFFEVKNSLYAVDIKNQIIILNNKFEIDYILKEPLKTSTLNLNSISEFVPIHRGRIREREFGVFSVLTKKILWINKNYKSLEIIKENVFSQSNHEFYSLKLLTGELIWKVDLKEYFPILDLIGRIQIIDVIHNRVLLGIENLDKLVALDIKSGELIWETSSITQGKLVMNDLIHSFSVNYGQLSIVNGKLLKSFIDRDYFEKIGIETQRSNYILIDNHIITTDWRKGKIGAFNIDSFKFDWVYEIEGVSFPSTNPIRYNAPYLYILDNKNTLHIFKKE